MFIKNFIEPINDTINKSTTLQEAINIMADNKLHHIVILENKKPIGIITEKDIVKFYKDRINTDDLAINHATCNLITLHGSRMAEYALSVMLDNNIRKIIIINSKNEYLGCIEQEQLIYKFEEELQDADLTIHQLINTDNEALIVDGEFTLENTLEMMLTHKVTSLLISIDDKPEGIISESDIVQLVQKNINLEQKVKNFMHSPIISIDIKSSVQDMINLMKLNKIRRIVVYDKEYEMYHIVNSTDLVHTLKGNYTKFLESKLYDARDAFNALSEYVIEILDMHDEQVIYWTNGITKANFDVSIDDDITKIIPLSLWSGILKELFNNKVYYKTIQIDEKHFILKGHYGTTLEDNIIKLFLTDITEIKNLTIQLEKENKLKEELLFNQSKMAQMGEMIGNISHQWKQPLSAITTAASGMQLKKEYGMLEDNEFVTITNQITKNSEYLSETIDVFKNFLTEEKIIQEVVLQSRIDTALNLVKPTLKTHHIQLINEINYEIPIHINMTVGELDQVLINILSNAKDILVKRKIEQPWIKISLSESSDKLIITIEDNGGGIENEILPKIFDQYFTTKEYTKGTGLGLDMSRKIIQRGMNGELYAKNSDYGAKFFIELPINAVKVKNT